VEFPSCWDGQTWRTQQSLFAILRTRQQKQNALHYFKTQRNVLCVATLRQGEGKMQLIMCAVRLSVFILSFYSNLLSRCASGFKDYCLLGCGAFLLLRILPAFGRIYYFEVSGVLLSMRSPGTKKMSLDLCVSKCYVSDKLVRLFLGALANCQKKKATDSFVMSVRPSLRQHGTTRLPLDGFSWHLRGFFFSKISREHWRSLIEIWQE
jgi:hypothetical protein